MHKDRRNSAVDGGVQQNLLEPSAWLGSTAFYSADLREFILRYEAVIDSKSPDDTLLEFLQTTYEAAADLGQWDRASLELGHTNT